MFSDLYPLVPKSDGRIEIPQKIIHKLYWENNKEVYVFNNNNLVITPYQQLGGEFVGRVILNSGRIRIPYSFLRKANIHNKKLIATTDIFEININKPELIIPNTRQQILFRPICPPYKFRGYWANGNILLYNKSKMLPNNYYLIAGYSNDKVGYLLATDVLLETILNARARAKKNNIDPCFIILFDPSIREEFRVYNIPNQNVNENIGKLLEENIISFIAENFKKMERKDLCYITNSPLVINNINFRSK